MPTKKRSKKKSAKAQPRFPGWQSRRFRGIVAGLLLLGIGLMVVQFSAEVRLDKKTEWWIPLDPQKRAIYKADIAKIFPAYTVWRWLFAFSSLKAGYYQVLPGETAFAVWKKFRQGLQHPIRLYLRPQRTPQQLASFLGKALAYDSTAWISTFQTYPWEKLGFTAATWMLLFLPDVYEVYWTVSPERFIERMQEAYQRFWNEERRKKAEALGLTPIEVGILASIVEHESYRISERPLIASVYLNRLRLGMPLQADPTVIYAIGDFSITRVTHKMLEIDSPYNTYKRRGLPPGPIGMPSVESIEAVLNYTPSGYLYFCARPDGSGYHDFSETYQEHLVKARTYQRALSRWLAQKK